MNMTAQPNADLGNAAAKTGMLLWIWISAVVIVLDQITKYFASAYLELYSPVPVFPLFNLTLAHNPGAAFSFLAGADGWQRWFFSTIAVLVSVVMCVWLHRMKKKELWLAISVALILGGALGNVIDRILLGYVVDFLDFYWGQAHFPAFNVADMAISVGAFMMAIDVFKNPNKPREEVSDE